MKRRIVKVGKIKIGAGQPLVLIAGPCVIESEKSALYHAEKLIKIASDAGIPFIYKSSYDKANRTSVDSFRGPGLQSGLDILEKIKERFKAPILSDVHCRQDIEEAVHILDIIQIPAFLSRQTDLILTAAETGKPVNVKKGQFMAPWDMKYVIEKIERAGNNGIIMTERGTSFGYNNLVSDMRSLPIMRGFGYPVVYDATHSAQLPGGKGPSSGGQREFVSGLARSAAAMGVDGIFIETHRDPDKALSDGPNMVSLKDLPGILKQIRGISEVIEKDV
ncbi:MAG: 3-deoxy-8-phosphooctulonate synthase [Candidatus Omnitrophica bacterium]|nr:3-deoxy-8-phosphooctulonate synthase [Candidatus Omnitrophota bacterium]